MVAKVINIKTNEPYDVYVGRGSKFGNPYSHIEGTSAKWVVETREEAIRLYEEWLYTHPELVAAAKRELKNKTLACYCYPLACHADVLLKIANEENGEELMNKTLVIVESPTKASKIGTMLGKNYIVLSCRGHIVDLIKGGKHGLGVDLTDNFKPHYALVEEQIPTLEELMKAAENVDQILLASDFDREGEAISWHLRDRLKELGKPIKRITFGEITKKAIQQAIKNPRDIDEAMFNAQQARRILDRITGFMASPFLMNTFKQTLSAGRVQSVLVRMIVDREREIEQFKPEEFWNLTVHLSKDNKTGFDTKYVSQRITNKSAAMDVKTQLSNQSYEVIEVEAKEEAQKASAPMITSTLQRVMSRTFGIDPEQTMRAAQSLYENGYCTYIRTDSVRTAPEAITEVRNWLQTNGHRIPKKANTFKTKNAAQNAHECIRPTDLSLLPDDPVEIIDPTEQKVYAVIWKHFVASQMTPALYDTLKIIAQVKDHPELQVKTTGKALKDKGFLEILDFVKIETKELDLPLLTIGDRLELFGKEPVKTEQKFTQAPPRYSADKLIKELENKQIGRPSTYSELISKITARQYVERQGNVFHATELGKQITDVLVKHFEFLDFDYTAAMESKLDLIAEGQQNYVQMLTEFFTVFQQELNQAYVAYGAELCDKCKSPMILKTTRDGKNSFLGCLKYPYCFFTKPAQQAS
jgi:DNA topoisomerase-1